EFFPLNRMMGKSDHGGCCDKSLASACSAEVSRLSSVMSAQPAPARMLLHRSRRSVQILPLSLACASTPSARTASRPTGARMSTPSSSAPLMAVSLRILFQRGGFTDEMRNSGQDPLKLPQRFSDGNSMRIDRQLADGVLVRAAALLDHRKRFQDGALRL